MRKHKETPHGTRYAYVHYGCRCDACKAANAEHSAKFRVAKKVEQPPEHGTYYSYIAYSCRCAECTNAHREQCGDYYDRTKSERAEYGRQYMRERYQNDPEFRQRVLDAGKRWREKRKAA